MRLGTLLHVARESSWPLAPKTSALVYSFAPPVSWFDTSILYPVKPPPSPTNPISVSYISAVVPAVPTPRLSADAAEWHPPSFVTATAQADIIGHQPEPISVAEIDANQDKPPESSAAPQPSTNSIKPPSTPRHEQQEAQAPPTTAAVVPDDSAADAQEPLLAASPVAVSRSGPVQEAAAVAASTAAAAEESGAAAAKTRAAAASEGHSESLDNSAQPPATLPETVPAKREDCAEGGDAAAAAFAGLEGKASGGKTEATAEAEDAEDYARGQGATDVASDPTDDDGSDPDLSCVDVGDGKDYSSSKFGGDDERGGEEGQGFFANPALLRWGGAVALVGALLVIGLRRGR